MKNRKRTDKPVINLVISLLVVFALTWVLSSFFYRFDLTTEKRYTLSVYSKEALRNLRTEVLIKVYLEGELNIPFRKMEQRIKETLDEFKVYAGDSLKYEFLNPFAGKDVKATRKLVDELYEKGLKATNIIARDKEGGTSEKIIFPGALVVCENIEIPVNLLKNNPVAGSEENINNSIQALEFEFMRIISSLSSVSTEKVAFIEGHGELNEYQVNDITRELGWYFQVDRGKINATPGILDQYKAVIIAKPAGSFSEQDKFVLDQYIMQGGKVLWFIDMVRAELDSLNPAGATMALINQPNIEDLLFRYGARINPVLLQDIQCNTIPVNVALEGNPADFRPVPWLYYPLLTAPFGNPITRNLNMISIRFAGTIDTIGARTGIKKTVLLRSSGYCRQVSAPVMISLDEIRMTPRQEQFTEGYQPVAVLLEGKFESAFRNRMTQKLFQDTVVKVRESGEKSAMLVVSDGDLIRNDIQPTPQGVRISPLGFDRYSKQTYGNKEFIVNAIQYLTGHQGLISLRSRQLTLRLLDKNKISQERTKWVLINLIGPPLVIILLGILYTWLRKRRFTGGLNTNLKGNP